MGKTIECLALILANPAPPQRDLRRATATGTLVVVPLSLLDQWEHEIRTRTRPGKLKYLVYHGPEKRASVSKDKMAKYDVVLTTYDELMLETKKKGGSTKVRRCRLNTSG